ncbi:taste receptor type 2 member 42-like [Sorex fumeus]|uniref:taste receptor type 2 member 42-like n=1 Tax=Sorex fumeus TaxID=62283 RepID=UPI0024AD4E5C|nr:taste receptor type 2 member 42-like [Sorex fumeus]
MLTSLETIFLTLAMMEFITGMLGNVFIGLVNCYGWVKTRKISFFDLILTGLAVSRICQLLVYLFESLVMGPFPELYTIYKLAKPCSLLWRITNHLATWFATCLSVVYFLKIAQYSHPLFLWIKWRTNRVVLVMLAFSLLLLIFDILLLETFNDAFRNSSTRHAHNLTLFFDIGKSLYVQSLIFLNLTYCIPSMVILISLLFLFLSMVRHTRNLQLNSLGPRDTSTEAHKKAMKMLMSFLFLAMVHSISTLLSNWIFHMFWNNKLSKFLMLAVYVFPLGHSFILILGNSKLRQTALKGLCHLQNFFMTTSGIHRKIFCSLFQK